VDGVACRDVKREGLSGKAILQILVSIVDQSFNPVAAALVESAGHIIANHLHDNSGRSALSVVGIPEGRPSTLVPFGR